MALAASLLSGCLDELPTDESADRPGRPEAIAPTSPDVARFRPLEGHGPAVDRARHQAARVGPDRVLIVGGIDRASGAPLASAELYLAADESFAPVAAMAAARVGHRATALLDGRVLVTGGLTAGDPAPLAATEIFDPASASFAPGPALAIGRHDHSATLLADGRVLIAGGTDAAGAPIATAEIFDPASASFAPTGAMTLLRAGHEAIALLDGRVLVTGGSDPDSAGGGGRDEAELYDPATGGFAPIGDMQLARNAHRLARLPSGAVLVTGATLGLGVVFADAELFDPASDPALAPFATTGAMTAGRVGHSATTLLDGRVLIAGGASDGGVTEGPTAPSDAAEVFVGASFAPLEAPMARARVGHSATLLADGRVLLVGGNAGPADAELFSPVAP